MNVIGLLILAFLHNPACTQEIEGDREALFRENESVKR